MAKSSSLMSRPHSKDPSDGRPRRPLTAYNIFFKEQRQRILAEGNGKSGGFTTLARTVAARWKSIDATEHARYCQMAAEEKRRYQQEELAASRAEILRLATASSGPVLAQRTFLPNDYASRSALSGACLQDMHFRSTSTDRCPSLVAAPSAVPSMESLITLRAQQLLARDLLMKGKEQPLTPVQGRMGAVNRVLTPVLSPPKTAVSIENVFDEDWLESECNLDMDDSTRGLLARMLDC